MTITFAKATKKQAKLRLAIQGPSGAGKSYSALEIAKHLVPGGRIAFLDTERGSASKYADKFDFDVCEIADNYHPDRLVEGLYGAASAGYDVGIIDSMTHFWNGPGGFLELVDEECKKMRARSGKADSHAAWKTVDVIYKRMIQKITGCPIHVIMTMRAKQEYVREEDDRGKIKIRKVGMAPEMRDNFQYEADVEAMLDMDHNLLIGKTRCDALDGRVFTKPGKDVADILRAWLSDGAPAAVTVPSAVVAGTSATTESNPADAAYDAKLGEAFAAAATAEEVAAIVASSVTPLNLPKDSTRRARITALYQEAKARVAAAPAVASTSDEAAA